eukprot:EG_transcript_22372
MEAELTENPQPLVHLLRKASYEIQPTAHARNLVLPPALPRGTRLYIPHLNRTTVKQIVTTAAALVRRGMVPVPHICPRRLRTKAAAESLLKVLAAVGVTDVLLVAGEIHAPDAELSTVLDLLNAVDLAECGIRTVGLVGHPQGLAAAAGRKVSDLDHVLLDKADRALAQGLQPYVVTQFCFDPRAVIDLAERLAPRNLPVVVGLPGVCSWASLLEFSRICGVPVDPMLLERAASPTHQPEALLQPIAEAVAREGRANIQGVHFFPFGPLRPTVEWAQGTLT